MVYFPMARAFLASWLMPRVGWGRGGQGFVGFNAQMKDAFSQPQPGCQVLFFQCSHSGVERAGPLLPQASFALAQSL